jgi:dihydroorotate dehydrogenase
MLALRLGGPWLPEPEHDTRLAREVCGIRFPNPVGLAAGFDKHALAVPHWRKLGFGFCEIGTFTRHPQAGNPAPRVWRYPKASALINRFGFNNPGADLAAERLERLRLHGAWPTHPVGINIGKSKVTPEGEAVEDYLYSLRRLQGFADYIAVNVSSPNTPGLRKLQGKAAISALVKALARETKKPIFVKFAPDMPNRSLLESAGAAMAAGASGIIVTNTTLSREGLGAGNFPEGGMSGAPLLQRANACLSLLARHFKGRVPLIGVGGILQARDAQAKLDLGACLVQVYTGFIYQGPSFAMRICETLLENCG